MAASREGFGLRGWDHSAERAAGAAIILVVTVLLMPGFNLQHATTRAANTDRRRGQRFSGQIRLMHRLVSRGQQQAIGARALGAAQGPYGSVGNLATNVGRKAFGREECQRSKGTRPSGEPVPVRLAPTSVRTDDPHAGDHDIARMWLRVGLAHG
jgi:hypothetical protein